jgi:WD40 repeat protein
VTGAARVTGISVGHDALGNVFVTGDGNTVDVRLTIVTADARLQARDAPPAGNPYRGLQAFGEADSAVFFGREDLIVRLWTRFHSLQRGSAPRILPVLGASGSGKSSLVRAGLLPELVRQPIDGMRSPIVLVLRPGAAPLQRLADGLARIAGGDAAPPGSRLALDAVHAAARAGCGAGERMVIFVDQLEELFTECDAEADRRGFLDALAHAADQPDRLVSVVFAMRNDFAGALRAHPAFADAVREHRFTASALSRAQLLDAIERPARALGRPWPTGLVESLALQCEGRSGALPLLQFALTRLWPDHLAGRLAESRWSSRLIEDFVVQAADALCEHAGAASARIIRRAFVAMVQLGEGAADTRRVARLSEIVGLGETGDQVRAVLAPFVAPEARLVTASEQDGEPTYELAHEALIGSWDRLRGWLGNGPRTDAAAALRSELRLLRRLDHAAASWRGDRDALWRPPELDLAAVLRARAPGALPSRGHDFLDASLAAWRRTLGWRRRVLRLIIVLVVVLAGFSVAMAVLGMIAWRRTQEAQRLIGMSQLEHGRTLLMDEHPMQALPYFVAARTQGVDSPELRALFAETSRSLPLVTLHGHGALVRTVEFSPDGKRLLTAAWDGTARVWDVATGAELLRLDQTDWLNGARFSPDGTRIVTSSNNDTARVWNATTGALLFDLRHRGHLQTAVFSPDGRRIVTAAGDFATIWDATTGARMIEVHHPSASSAGFDPRGERFASTSTDGTVWVWNATTGKPLAGPLRHRERVWSAAFSHDGKCLVTASDDQTARIWNAATGKPLAAPLQHAGIVFEASFNPDDTRVVTASDDRTARIWDAATGRPATGPLEHKGGVVAATFSPDGTSVATCSVDDTARIWDAATGQPQAGPLEHQSTVNAAAFSPDGTRLATASEDHMVRIWDATGGGRATRPFGHDSFIEVARFSPDRTRLVTGGQDHMARIWNITTGQLVAELSQWGQVLGAAFSADGTRLVTVYGATVWNVETGRPVAGPFEQDGASITVAALNAHGTRAAIVRDDGTFEVHDVSTGAVVVSRRLPGDGDPRAEALSPDDRTIAVGREHATLVLDATTGQTIAGPMVQDGSITALAFSPDGTRVVTASSGDVAIIWDAATGRAIAGPLTHQSSISFAAFSPDGTRVVTGSADKTARIWDAATGRAMTGPLRHGDDVAIAAFSPDGARVATGSADGTARIWDVASGQPLTPALRHGGEVTALAFSADGARLLAASYTRRPVIPGDGTSTAAGDDRIPAWSRKTMRIVVRTWPVAIDTSSLADWQLAARCSPFELRDAVIVDNPAALAVCPIAARRAGSP